jgi:hypothetical protein
MAARGALPWPADDELSPPMNRVRFTLLGMLAVMVALALAAPGGALASGRQVMILQDDAKLIYSSPQSVASTLLQLRHMGVDRVRVSVVWQLLAPTPSSTSKPKFDATNPNAYPKGVWFRYDFLDRVATQDGLQVYFQPTAPAPTWATPPRKLAQGYRFSHDPNAADYGQFVQAVAKRYSGNFVAPNASGQSTKLPAVRYWGIWNEPNIGGWMTPQWNTLKSGKKVEASPAIYRAMVDAAWKGLVATGHRHDTIMIGETAAYGAGHKGYGASMDPLTFVRAFYCLSGAYTPLKGTAATQIGCPASGSRGAFVHAHPALFDAAGWAHHPYDFAHPPDYKRSDPDSSTLSGLSRIEKALDRSARAYHQRAGKPIDITEWGVQSRNPSPYVNFSQAQQAEFINQGEYMAWTNPRVPSFSQFLLVDDGPNTQYKKGSRGYWSTFQSGLLTYPSDQPKPAYYAFELPIWLPQPKHGSHVYVWGQIRPQAPRKAVLQFKARGSSTWADVATVTGSGPEGFFTTHVKLPSAGGLRISWSAPGNVPFDSRIATVS